MTCGGEEKCVPRYSVEFCGLVWYIAPLSLLTIIPQTSRDFPADSWDKCVISIFDKIFGRIYFRHIIGTFVIRTDLREMGCGYMDWIGLAQDRDRWRTLVSAVMKLRVPWNAGNFLTSCKPVSFSRRTLHHGLNKYRDVCTWSEICSAEWNMNLLVSQLSGYLCIL